MKELLQDTSDPVHIEGECAKIDWRVYDRMMMQRNVRLSILGLGTVGGGVVKLLRQMSEKLERNLQLHIDIVRVCARSSRRLKELQLDESLFTSDLDAFFSTPCDIVVEVGGLGNIAEHLAACLAKGTRVVSANKALLSRHGRRLMGAAGGENLFYEASCLGGIPIISSLEEGLQSNNILSIAGIFNGTCNFVLGRMRDAGVSFDEALKEAQQKGFAEANPSADVDGVDATHKLSLLASLAFGRPIACENLRAEGIREVQSADIAWAKSHDHVVKLISMAEKLEDGRLFCSTFPCLVPDTSPLAHVERNYNAIMVRGHAVEDLMYYGPGAGEMPTASSVVSDILAAANGAVRRHSRLVFRSPPMSKDELRGERPFSHYIRMQAVDEAGVLARLATRFAEHGISLKFVHQEPLEGSRVAQLIVVTHPHLSSVLDKALEGIQGSGLLTCKALVLRILEL